MNTSHYASAGHNPWSDGDRYLSGVQLIRPDNVISQVAAQRYALLTAVSELRSSRKPRAGRRSVWHRSHSAVAKTV